MAWVKVQPCCICSNPGPSIVDHMYGATFKHLKILIGMWALLPYCLRCDGIKTQGSHKAHLRTFGTTQADLWASLFPASPVQPPLDVVLAIADWGR